MCVTMVIQGVLDCLEGLGPGQIRTVYDILTTLGLEDEIRILIRKQLGHTEHRYTTTPVYILTTPNH